MKSGEQSVGAKGGWGSEDSVDTQAVQSKETRPACPRRTWLHGGGLPRGEGGWEDGQEGKWPKTPLCPMQVDTDRAA